MGTRWPELRELTRLRALTFLRVPEAVFWVFAFPMILAAVLGFAFQSSEPAATVVGVLPNAEGTALLERLEADALVDVKPFPDREAADRSLRAGKLDALVIAPTEEPPLLRLDKQRPEAEVARLRVLIASGDIDPDGVEIEEVTERGSRYVDFLFPGLLGMNLMGTGLWAIAFGVAEMRQRKVLRRLLVTPMRRSSLLASFITSRLLFLAMEVGILTLFGVFVLGVPLRGGLFQFALLCLLGSIAFAGLGLLSASRVKTIEGASGMMNLIMMPMWLGSGVFFSYERFPEFIHPVLRALPLTALNDALRKSMLEGESIAAVAPEIGVLAVWLVVPFVVALKIFRWK